MVATGGRWACLLLLTRIRNCNGVRRFPRVCCFCDKILAMQRIEHKDGIVTYTFDQLAGYPVVAHVTARHGGVSPEPWKSLNFSVARGDDPANVTENRKRLASVLGYDYVQRVYCQQTHGTGIAKVDANDLGTCQMECDGAVTDSPDVPISLIFGDCVPVLLYDPAKQVLAGVHAGWRGTVNGAAVAALWSMVAGYGTDPADVLACIGPSIGPDSYEVGEEVVELVQAKLTHADRLLIWKNGGDRPFLDLWEANASQLVEQGVLREKVEIAGIDTAQRTDDFFSHRAEKGKCGLFAMVSWLVS